MFIFDVYLILILVVMLIICVLVSVAFLTLFERKVLGFIQLRKGPNKVGFLGILQPFSDAIKLFTKEQTYPIMSNYMMYLASPMLSLFLSLFIWISFPFLIEFFSFSLGLLFVLSCLGVGVYPMMISGWSSNSNYALLGSIRAISQTISYEVSMALTLLSFVFLIESYNLKYFLKFQEFSWFLLIFNPLVFVWVMIMMAETNRSPFDFAEGESELVSGFNVEYSSGSFAFIFLSEYSMILFMSFFFVLIFMGGVNMSIMFYIKLIFISFLFIWVRGTLPRFRYDKLMYLAWKCFLPLSLNFLLFIIGLKIFMLLFIMLMNLSKINSNFYFFLMFSKYMLIQAH